MNTLFIWLFLASLAAGIAGLIKPALFAKVLKQRATRKFIALGSFGAALILFFLIGATGQKTPVGTVADLSSSRAITFDIAGTDDLDQLRAGLLVQTTLGYMTMSFVDARLSTDALLQVDFNEKSVGAWNADHDEVMKKWAKEEEARKLYIETLAAIGDKRLSPILSPKPTF